MTYGRWEFVFCRFSPGLTHQARFLLLSVFELPFPAKHRGKVLLPVNSLFPHSLRRSCMLPMDRDIFLRLSGMSLWVKLPEANVILFLLSIIFQSLRKWLASWLLLSSRESSGGFYMEGAFQLQRNPTALRNPNPGCSAPGSEAGKGRGGKRSSCSLLWVTILISWLKKRRERKMTHWIMYSLNQHWLSCLGHVRKTSSLRSRVLTV